jgi:hypothetical protein
MNINASLATFGGLMHAEAMRRVAAGVTDPFLGALSIDEVQLVPQSVGQLTEDVADELMAAYPGTAFRLHANTRVLRERHVLELDAFDPQHPYWRQLATISQRLKARGYTAHAGRRESGKTLAQVFDATRAAADLFCCDVGIEGAYPTRKGDPWLLSSWSDYRAMLDSGVPFALDLSHLNIVRHLSRKHEDGLVEEMLASEACMEIHVSGNTGFADEHRMLTEEPWWWPMMSKANPAAVIFSEGAPPKSKRAH